MAILNVTPDSFYAGSRTPDAAAIETRVREALEAGASLIDVGGYSSRPGADEVSPEEEWRRVSLGVETVRRMAPELPVSVDTFRSGVARRTIERFGAVIVNDISAGELDPEMFALVAESGVPYVAMHMKGTPQTMQSQTDYRRDITTEVVDYFRRRSTRCWRRESAANESSSIRVSVSRRPRSRISNCWPVCTACAGWVSRCWRVCRASR